MLLGSFLGRGLMQSQSDAQLPICHLLKDFRDLSERENLPKLKERVLESYATSILVGKNKTKERWGKLADKHVEREAWLETHKETK